MVILNKIDLPTNYLCEFSVIKTLIEKASFVAKYCGFNDQNIWNRGSSNFHRFEFEIHDLRTKDPAMASRCYVHTCHGSPPDYS